MADETTTVKHPSWLWLNRDSRTLIRKKNNGRMVQCWTCPCCKPRVIASTITNASYTHMKTWDLTPWQGDHVGLPGHRWRLRDVGEAHWNNTGANCSGSQYYAGTIDANGKLVGLPDKFTSSYGYNGYMQLQQGCLRDDGSIEWPCPNG